VAAVAGRLSVQPDRLERLRARAEARGMFAPGRPVASASAPGRLDVMGGIADYSGSLVLQLPLALRATALAAARTDGQVRVLSLGQAVGRVREPMGSSRAGGEVGGAGERLAQEGERDAGSERFLAMPLAELLDTGCTALGERLRAQGAGWFAYLAGIVPVLAAQGERWPAGGFDLAVASEVPEGKGVSSSAAVEVASAAAILQAVGLRPGPRGPEARRELALLCQKVENLVAGAACGVMDQMTAACGRPGELLRLLCQPAEVEGHVPVPDGFAFWGVDSGVRHAVSGSDYTSVRTGAFMGFRVLAELAGVPTVRAEGRVEFAHPRWGRYLANVPLAEWQAWAAELPERMSGAAFLARYGGTSDPVTRVDPARTYAVRQPTAHPIHEHARVRAFAAALPHAHEPGVATRLGELMYASHASYTACGLGHAATDAVVDAVRDAGPARGLFGAKITGGGCGGTVAVFGRADAFPLVRHLAATVPPA
jgi:L-arabinokinase